MSLILADARRIPLVDECVQCVVTSPPYFGLRDYGHSAQIGLESSPDAYVAALLRAFQEVRRVLAVDGVCWLNLGDSYGGDRGNKTPAPDNKHRALAAGSPHGVVRDFDWRKQLIGIPWRVVFALQADGWYLRSDVIWSKPNPMPESVTDRPTKSHEYVFLLAKSERYHYDADAISEPVSSAMVDQVARGYDGLGLKDYESAGVQNPSSVKARIIANARKKQGKALTSPRNDGNTWNENNGRGFIPSKPTRNVRTVWSVPTMPYPGAHFATMPEKLAERCILAGSRPGDLVLDPFGGSGTTVRVARRLNRRGVMLDLNAEYLKLAEARTMEVQVSLLEAMS